MKTRAGWRRTSALAVLASACLLQACKDSAPEIQADVELYSTAYDNGGSSPNTLISVDRESGQQVAVGTAGSTRGQTALAWDAGAGVLYGVNFFGDAGHVFRIDPTTGATTVAAHLSKSPTGIAVAPDGRVYVILMYTTLATVDLSTQAISEIGTIPGGPAEGLDFGDDGTLYVIGTSAETGYQALLTLDPATASVTSSFGLRPLQSDLAWHPDGYLYASNSSFLIRIDLQTQLSTEVGHGSLGAVGGLAAVPVQ